MMFKLRKTTLALVCLVVALSVATVSEANDFGAARRDHVDVGRMIKKRQGLLGPIIGAGSDPKGTDTGTSTAASSAATSAATSAAPSAATSAATSDATSAPATSAAQSSTQASSGTSAASSAQSSAASSTSSAASSSSTASSSSASSASSTSQSSSSSSTTQSSTSATPTPTPAQPTDTPDDSGAADAQTSSAGPRYVSKTVTAQPSQTSAATDTGATSTGSITRTTIVVLVAVGASIGALALVWTVIRKWKLKPSSRFDDRMQPIDWQPTGDDSGVPDHRRASVLSHGSFHSGNGHGSDSGHGHGNSGIDPIPEHDFTAVPQATLAPIGGYADLQRGPSPGPQMNELARGPSFSHPGYEQQYAVPAHYGGGYEQQYNYNGAANPRY